MKAVGRTYFCGEVPSEAVKEKITLKGWVARTRITSNMIFVLLRDRTGIIQVSIPTDGELAEKGKSLKNEYVIEVVGSVNERLPVNINPEMKTGSIEVIAEEITVMNQAKTPPFYIENDSGALEDLRMKYRYLDLRRPVMYDTLLARHILAQTVREFLNNNGFLEIETPLLTKSTPEGARDYLVPSRVHEGEFYALPQSPQIFKQLLMVSGVERYYQIARCFRDEDLRVDRQPEFTQLDIEMSFFSQEDIINLIEELMVAVVEKVRKVSLETPLPRISHEEALNRFGVDNPDIRFGMELVDISDVAAETNFSVFHNAINTGGQVKGLNIQGGGGKFSRKEIDKWGKLISDYGAKGLAWVKIEEDKLSGPVSKFFPSNVAKKIKQKFQAKSGDLLVFVAGGKEIVLPSLGNLRNYLGVKMELFDPNEFQFVWVVDWPLFEYDVNENKYVAAHHPFTRPVLEDLPKLDDKQSEVRAMAYDLVLNGSEIGGGSMRIFEGEVQRKMFSALGLANEEIEEKFGFLLEALSFGAPPHGGFAFGFDRFLSILTNKSMRDVIAFPKTNSAKCLMTEAPNPVSSKQLANLHIDIKKMDGDL